MYSVFVLLFIPYFTNNVLSAVITERTPLTTSSLKGSSQTPSDVEDLSRNLYIGRCKPEEENLLHAETIVVNGDDKGKVDGLIKIHLDTPFKIKCMKVLDKSPPGESGYPFYVSGGPGQNSVTFGMKAEKGFRIYVIIFGKEQKDKQ